MKKKQEIIFITMCIMAVLILIVTDIVMYNYIDNYNATIKNMKTIDKIDYDGEYDHVFIKGIVSTDEPIKFKDKKYLSVKYVKQKYQKHIEYDYEKKWNGRFWYQEKTPKEVWGWSTVEKMIYVRPKIKFANIIFDENIVYEMNYKLIDKVENDSIRKYYYVIENNQEVIMYIKDWNNGEFEELNIYNSYSDAVNDICMSATEKFTTIILIDLLICLVYTLIFWFYTTFILEE